MNVKEMYPSKTLSGADVPSPIQATIARIKIESLGRGADANEKPVLSFQGSVKPMVLNKTNAKVLARQWGNDSAAWIGKTVEIYFDPNVEYAGERVGGLRLRIPTHVATNGGPACWTLQQAADEGGKFGITKADIIAKLKAAGFGGWKADRDTAVVQAMIAAKSQAEESFGEEEPEKLDPPPPGAADGEIPFSWALPLLLSAASLIGMA